jgi:hypothetical protein
MEENIMGLFGNLFKSAFEILLDTASDEDLTDEYEKRRLEWLKDGSGYKTKEMQEIDEEMARRMNEKYEKEHPNAKARHREHGWHLPNDDD